MSTVLGIDLSTHNIDLVTLDENSNRAHWHRITLQGDNAFDRVLDIRRQRPRASWFVNEDIYLVAIERPFSQSRNDVVRLVQGAVIASVPRELSVWEVAPQTWKAHLKFKGRGKPALADFPACELVTPGEWPQDALDALGVALYARDTNAALIAEALKGAA